MNTELLRKTATHIEEDPGTLEEWRWQDFRTGRRSFPLAGEIAMVGGWLLYVDPAAYDVFSDGTRFAKSWEEAAALACGVEGRVRTQLLTQDGGFWTMPLHPLEVAAVLREVAEDPNWLDYTADIVLRMTMRRMRRGTV